MKPDIDELFVAFKLFKQNFEEAKPELYVSKREIAIIEDQIQAVKDALSALEQDDTMPLIQIEVELEQAFMQLQDDFEQIINHTKLEVALDDLGRTINSILDTEIEIR